MRPRYSLTFAHSLGNEQTRSSEQDSARHARDSPGKQFSADPVNETEDGIVGTGASGIGAFGIDALEIGVLAPS
jgi:hypothetical protein